MDIDDLRLLGDSLLRYRQERYSFAQRKDMLGQAGGFGAKAWADYADMGWCSSAVAADEGGFDNDAAVVVALMRHVGECLAMEPLLGSAIVCGAMLSACGAAGQSHLQALAQGKQIFSLAHLESQHSDANASMTTHAHEGRLSGSKVLVLHGDAADALIVTARSPDSAQLSLHWVDPRAPGVKCTPYPLVDQRHAASFEFDGVLAQPLAQGQAAQDALALGLRMETLGLCAEAHGAMSALNRFTLAHLKERRQFGRPIGANQALRPSRRRCALVMMSPRRRSEPFMRPRPMPWRQHARPRMRRCKCTAVWA